MAETAQRADHDLPMLRVHDAWEAAERIADERGVSHAVALEIAREVVAVVGEGTRRWGRLCTDCRSLLEIRDGAASCPQHGPLSTFDPAVLLISFDPIKATS